MSQSKSPFNGAKIGDWIIDERGRCAQIIAIEDGEFGGVRTGKYTKYFWNGEHQLHKGGTISARMATAQEVEAWQHQQEAEAAERQRQCDKDERMERIRDAAPQLFEACQTAVKQSPPHANVCAVHAGDECDCYVGLCRAAIAVAARKAVKP